MDVIFDIDGTLADASHRLHFIKDMNHWVAPHGNPLVPRKPDWDTFLSDEQVAKDTPIVPVWKMLLSIYDDDEHRILFITGRPERQRRTTTQWLMDDACDIRGCLFDGFANGRFVPSIYMRADGDRRPSDVVKEEGLMRARADGFDPKMVFEDRAGDTAMWRRNGLLCCQVAEGNY